jgi:hypothetical protein
VNQEAAAMPFVPAKTQSHKDRGIFFGAKCLSIGRMAPAAPKVARAT